MSNRCEKCGQEDVGQTGEYPCARCGLPTAHDQAATLPKRCLGKNCHAGAGDSSVEHSLQCQEETIYTYGGKERPEVLECERLIADRWQALSDDPRFNEAVE